MLPSLPQEGGEVLEQDVQDRQKGRIAARRRLLTVIIGALLLVLPSAQAQGKPPPGSGCTTTLEGGRIVVEGSCYFSPPWAPGVSLELHGSVWGAPDSRVSHLTEGKVRAFRVGGQVEIAVEGRSSMYALQVAPREVAEVSLVSGGDVFVFSRKGETNLAVSYLTAPLLLAEGEGRVIVLDPPGQPKGCSMTASSEKTPNHSVNTVVVGLLLSLVLLQVRRRKTPQRSRARPEA